MALDMAQTSSHTAAELETAFRLIEQAAFELALNECGQVVYQFGKHVPMTAAQQCIDRITKLMKERAT